MGFIIKNGLIAAIVSFIATVVCFYSENEVLTLLNFFIVIAVTFLLLGRAGKAGSNFGIRLQRIFFANLFSGLVYLLLLYLLFSFVSPELAEAVSEIGLRGLSVWEDKININENWIQKIFKIANPEETFGINQLVNWYFFQWIVAGGICSLVVAAIKSNRR